MIAENFQVSNVFFRGKAYDNDWLKESINDLSGYLNKNFISDSPFVLLTAYNHIKTLVSFYAILKTGKIAVIVSPEIKDIELTEIIEETDPAAMILIDTVTTTFDYEVEILIRKNSPNFFIGSNIDDVLLIMYTNAEDGKSKGAMITEQSLLSSIYTYAGFEGISDTARICSMAPYYHLLGLAYGLILPVYFGCSIYITDLNLFRMSEIVNDFQKIGVNYIISVPSFYYLMSKIPDIHKLVLNINDFISGGIKLPMHIYESFHKKTQKTIREGYGLTETSPGVSLTPRDYKTNPESIGRVFSNSTLKIMNERGKECLTNEIGEIWITGESVFKGYLNYADDEGKYKSNGWLKTGDLGSFDSHGNLYFHGLKKNMFNVAGNNVYPRELERLIAMNKHVRNVKIFKEESMLQGDVVGADVELDEVNEQAIKKFKTWCTENITKNKLPKIWNFLK